MRRPSEPIQFRPRPRASRYEPGKPPRRAPRGLPPAPGEPTAQQLGWLRRGLDQPGGKLPLFDEHGRRIDPRTIRACLAQGWAEKWFDNPLKADWLVCRLSAKGRALAAPAE